MPLSRAASVIPQTATRKVGQISQWADSAEPQCHFYDNVSIFSRFVDSSNPMVAEYRKNLFRSVESLILKRMRTRYMISALDYISGITTPMEEVLRALDDSSAKARCPPVGASNFRRIWIARTEMRSRGSKGWISVHRHATRIQHVGTSWAKFLPAHELDIGWYAGRHWLVACSRASITA